MQTRAFHSSLAGVHQQLLPGWISNSTSARQQPLADVLSIQQQQQGLARDVMASSCPAGLQNSSHQGPGWAQASSAVQLPVHVQEWLASLATTAQPSVVQHAAGARAASPVRSPDAVHAARELHEDLQELRAELADVKRNFAETQVCFQVAHRHCL